MFCSQSLALILLFWQWRLITSVAWRIESEQLALAATGASLFGWLLVLTSTFLINHFELFGLHQVASNLAGRSMAEPQFRTPLSYRFVRHPIYLGFIIAFWATPVMTLGHLLFAAVTTAYIVVATLLEERDLIALFGDEYRRYKRLQQMGREHGVAVITALALLDTDQHALAVDIVDLERHDLRHPQARTIGDCKCRLVLRPRCCGEQADDLLLGEDRWQLACLPDDHQLARQIRPIKRRREEEAQRRDGDVDGRRRRTGLSLMHLEAAHLFRSRRIRRAFKERRELPNATDVVIARLLAEAAQMHVGDHALAQRRASGGRLSFDHGELLSE
jgi:protein-S-isoprenylcysteine O-methyltransferase Ste14